MTDLYRIADEILPQKIHELVAEKGLTTANIEHAYKLVDMYKDLKEVEHWESEDMEEGRSQRGKARHTLADQGDGRRWYRCLCHPAKRRGCSCAHPVRASSQHSFPGQYGPHL